VTGIYALQNKQQSRESRIEELETGAGEIPGYMESKVAGPRGEIIS
jgi:hypothetical protein